MWRASPSGSRLCSFGASLFGVFVAEIMRVCFGQGATA